MIAFLAGQPIRPLFQRTFYFIFDISNYANIRINTPAWCSVHATVPAKVAAIFTCLLLAISSSHSQAASPLLPFAVGLGGGALTNHMMGPTTDVGAIDYAVAPILINGAPKNCTPLKYKFDPTNTNQVVKKKDIYEVILKHIKLGSDANKELNTFSDMLTGHLQLAVIANGFEMSSSPGSNNGFDFSPSSANSGRVIYYSDDVKGSQFLNFGQLTMFGPVEYQGNPVAISLYVLKIANDASGKMAPMLSSLSTLGKNISTPEVTGVLETLGTQLLKGQDARIFRYDTMLRARTDKSIPNLATGDFLYGDYILIRQEVRQKPIDWEKYRYNPLNGKLYTDEACTKEEGTVSYGVIQVNKGNKVAYMKYASYGDLRKAIADAAANAEPSAAAKAMQKASEDYSQTLLYNQALATIESSSGETKPSLDQRAELQTVLKNIKDSISSPAGKLDPTRHFSSSAVDKLLFAIGDATQHPPYTKANYDAAGAWTSFTKRWAKE